MAERIIKFELGDKLYYPEVTTVDQHDYIKVELRFLQPKRPRLFLALRLRFKRNSPPFSVFARKRSPFRQRLFLLDTTNVSSTSSEVFTWELGAADEEGDYKYDIGVYQSDGEEQIDPILKVKRHAISH